MTHKSMSNPNADRTKLGVWFFHYLITNQFY